MVYDVFIFFFNDTATTEIYTLSLHDALPISKRCFPRDPTTPLARTRRQARSRPRHPPRHPPRHQIGRAHV